MYIYHAIVISWLVNLIVVFLNVVMHPKLVRASKNYRTRLCYRCLGHYRSKRILNCMISSKLLGRLWLLVEFLMGGSATNGASLANFSGISVLMCKLLQLIMFYLKLKENIVCNIRLHSIYHSTSFARFK